MRRARPTELSHGCGASAASFALALGLFGCGGGDGVVPESDRGNYVGPPPVSLDATITPGRAFYQTGQNVRVRAEVLDAAGNPLDGVPLTFRAAPAASTMAGEDPDRFILEAEGSVTLEACTAITGQEPLCDAVQILVDDGSPVLEVSSPRPGAQLGGEGITTLEVSGSVADDSVSVSVAGMPATVDAMGRFRAEVEPRLGVNHLVVSASDGLSDPAVVELDVLFAERYLPATEDGRPALRTDGDLALQLGQALLDDGMPFDPEASPLVTEDLADLAELVLAEADLAALLPDPLLDAGPELQLSATSVRALEAEVDLALVEEGVEVFLRLPRVALETTGAIGFGGFMLDLSGGMDLSASLVARVRVRRENAEMPLEVSLEGLGVSLEAVEGRFDSEDANALVALAESGLARALEDALTAAVEDVAAELLLGLVTELLGTVEGLLTGVMLTLEVEGLPATDVLVDGELGPPFVEAGRRMQLPLDLFLRTASPIAFPDSPGAADFGGVAADPFVAGRPLQLGARLATVNQALHVLWNSGLLDVDVTTFLPETISGLLSRGRLVARMPPVVRVPRGAETGDLIVSLGQAELELESLGDTTRYGLGVDVGARLVPEEGGLGLVLDSTPRVRAWQISTEGIGPTHGHEGPALADLFVSQLWGTLTGLVADLRIEVPAIALPLEGLAPELAGFALEVGLDEGLETRGGSIVLPATLRGAFAPEEAGP